MRHLTRKCRIMIAVCLCLAATVAAIESAATTIVSEGVIAPDAVLRDSPPLLTLRGAADSTIAAMVATVNEDTLFAFLEGLTGEVPVDLGYATRFILSRYSGSEGADKAADLLDIVFSSYGYEVARHYYLLPLAIQNICPQSDGSAIAVAGAGYVLATPDGGVWSRHKAGIDTVDVTLRAVDHVDGDNYVLVGNGGVIATSADGGATWTQHTGYATTRLNGVAVNETGIGWAVGKTGQALRTTDGGVSWSSQTSGVSDFLYDVAALDDSNAIAVGANGVVRRTTDGGANWFGVASGTGANLLRVEFQGSRGWAVGAGGTIIASTNSGANWFHQTSGTTVNLSGVAFADADHGWVVGSTSTILHTSDGGTTWTPQATPVATLSLTAVGAASVDEGWVGGVSGNLFHTTNGGTDWTNVSGTIQAGWSNVEAALPGTTTPEEEVLLVGHYDSISDIPDPGDLAPGADDNGSGIAVIVETARNMMRARYERTIRFVCFSGEEGGLYGSEAHAARAESLGTQIVGVFNLDSVGWNDNYFRIFSNAASTWLGDTAQSMANTYAPGLTTYHWDCPGCTWSDHASYWSHGFPAIVGIETWDPPPSQHHTTGDTLGLLDIPLISDVAKLSLATIATVASVDTTVVSAIPDLQGGEQTEVFAFRLHEPHPNPFAATTTIRFSLAAERMTRLRVVDAAGRLVATLRHGALPAGDHRVTWDGRNQAGRPVAAGVYFCTLEVGRSEQTQKVVLMR